MQDRQVRGDREEQGERDEGITREWETGHPRRLTPGIRHGSLGGSIKLTSSNTQVALVSINGSATQPAPRKTWHLKAQCPSSRTSRVLDNKHEHTRPRTTEAADFPLM